MNLLLIHLILLVNLVNKIRNEKIFQCDAADELKVQRFWYDGYDLGFIYLLLANKAIVFELPYFGKINKQIYPTKADDIYFINKLPLVYAGKNNLISKTIIGYLVSEIYDNQSSKTYELYRIDNNAIKGTELYMFDGEHYYKKNFIYPKLKDEDKDVEYILIFEFKDRNRFRKDMKIVYILKYFVNRKLSFFYVHTNTTFYDFNDANLINDMKLAYNVKWTMFYQKKTHPKTIENLNNTLIEIDNEDRIHFKTISLQNLIVDNVSSVDVQEKVTMNLRKFLNCHQPFKSKSQVWFYL